MSHMVFSYYTSREDFLFFLAGQEIPVTVNHERSLLGREWLYRLRFATLKTLLAQPKYLQLQYQFIFSETIFHMENIPIPLCLLSSFNQVKQCFYWQLKIFNFSFFCLQIFFIWLGWLWWDFCNVNEIHFEVHHVSANTSKQNVFHQLC